MYKAPFLKAVEKLGWAWAVVLKQERMEVLQEARAVRAVQKPGLEFPDRVRDRQVKLWEVTDLDFSKSYGRKVRVVLSLEQWVEHKVIGGKKTVQPRTSHWAWMASAGLQDYPRKVVWAGGHRRWGIEPKAFHELTQFYHLEHCYHHEPAAMLAQMLVLILGFVLFSACAVLHSQQVRLGWVSLKELAHDLDLGLEQELRWELWFASG
jgi:hypothetical protein